MAQPDLILTPFGANAPAGNIDVIPETLAPSDPPQKASWQGGFPPVTMIPLAAGGIPPRGQDFNGVLNAISKHTVFQEAGGFYKWSAEVVAKGGYEKDAIVLSDDGMALYQSAINSNTDNFNTNPSSIGVSWKLYSGISAQNQKVDKTTQVIAGTGLTGGGTLGANVVLNVAYGSTAGTAAQGNDSRITGAVQAAGTGLTKTGTTLSVKYGTTAGTAAQGNDPRLSDAREWTAQTVSQAEAEAGTATTRRAWTAQRVRQAIVAWWNGVSTTWSRGFVSSASAAEARNTLGLGTAATRDVTTGSTDTTPGRLMQVGAFGLGATPIGYSSVDSLPLGTYFFNGAADSDLDPLGTTVQTLRIQGASPNRFALLQIGTGTPQNSRASSIGYTPFNENGSGGFRELYHTGNISTASVAHAETAGHAATATTATTALNALGVGQTWQNVTSEIINNTIRTNTTGRPIQVIISGGKTQEPGTEVYIDGITAAVWSGSETDELSITFTLPSGSSYKVVNIPQFAFVVLELK